MNRCPFSVEYALPKKDTIMASRIKKNIAKFDKELFWG